MKNYTKLIEATSEEKVTELITTLRDNNFGNEESRKMLLDIMSSLINSKDPRARKACKLIGNMFTTAGNDILGNVEEKDIDVTVNMDIEEVGFEFDEEEDEYEDMEEDDDSPYVSYFDDDNYYD